MNNNLKDWLYLLTSEKDIDHTIGLISHENINLVLPAIIEATNNKKKIIRLKNFTLLKSLVPEVYNMVIYHRNNRDFEISKKDKNMMSLLKQWRGGQIVVEGKIGKKINDKLIVRVKKEKEELVIRGIYPKCIYGPQKWDCSHLNFGCDYSENSTVPNYYILWDTTVSFMAMCCSLSMHES